MVSRRTSALRTLGFAALYLLATYAGRLTVMDATNLSLVWPAAGVSAVWFLVQCTSRWRFLDVLALAAVTMVVNVATGAPAPLAAWFVVANLVQALVFVRLFRRWLPHLWGGGGDRPLARTAELWRLATASFLATACGALLGPTGVWLVEGHYSWPATAVWLTRNTVSILLIGVTGLRIGHLVAHHLLGPGWWRVLRDRWSAAHPARQVEYLAVLLLSAAAYATVFGIHQTLPLAFAVIVMTVWAGSRLHTAFVVVHDLLFGTVAILCTLRGYGVFAQIASHPARALVAQAFVGMIAVVGLALALGRDERAALIAEMRAEKQAAGNQAALMNAIVDAMTEGLTVIDEQGRVLLRNPAVRDLMGTPGGDRVPDPGDYGLFRPDGSPLPPDEMPYRRALDGQIVRGQDVLVRNANVPDGRILSISAQALPGDLDGVRCAVTVFHDVTAERRHRGELASFAGVVAHDLLNPLATVEGWTESLAETFLDSPHPDAAEARDGLARVSRAAVRMRNLINDLLAYTTARDAVAAPTMTMLGEVVRDIAVARIDQAESTGRPVPVFDLGELHPVHADPVLLRQLLDNLISNAIKYTAAGVVPHLRIRTGQAGGFVTVTIDDNGIGIPEGQHAGIFDDFHRAHTGGGYSGTGLGLGICKRIVERHGGTIGASANPDGHGSRFTFTLPADATAVPATAAPPAVRTEEPAPVLRAALQPLDPGEPAPPPAATFENAARIVLDYLHERMPLAFWAVTRVEDGRQTYLYLDADNGYGLRQGSGQAWQDTYCMHMVAGNAPTVARDAQAVPQYAASPSNRHLTVGTYAAAVITEPDGSLFGAICGMDPQKHVDDPRMSGAESLLAMLGRLLSTALAADRAHDRSANWLLRTELGTATDPVTGLPDRQAWERVLALAQHRRELLPAPAVVAVLSLDPLHAVADGGHTYLQATAHAARRTLRDSDVVARIGDTVFGIVLTRCGPDSADLVIARLHLELSGAGVRAAVGWSPVGPDHDVTAALRAAQADVATPH
ncbi:hypothetical protein Acsp01_68570 [Actinoplanes sp. NBRC 101535]|nr:hypothetical protein Acsp01_68570 [Actinoplanes sp. NBRC 101535]